MTTSNLTVEPPKTVETAAQTHKAVQKPAWETPKLDDVSEQVMAQPYIRFT